MQGPGEEVRVRENRQKEGESEIPLFSGLVASAPFRRVLSQTSHATAYLLFFNPAWTFRSEFPGQVSTEKSGKG